MHKLKISKIDILSYKRSAKLSPYTRITFNQTLEYVLKELKDTYFTPDDIDISVLTTGILYDSKLLIHISFINKKKLPTGLFKTKEKLILKLEYKTDSEMTTSLYNDIMKILGRFGLSAFYSTSDSILIHKDVS